MTVVYDSTGTGTVVALDAIWFNDAADPSDARAFQCVGDSYQFSDKVGGGVESGYASGRSRSFSTADDDTTFQGTLQGLSSADRDWLRSKRGKAVCVRDPLGRKVFGVFYDTPFTYGIEFDNLQCAISLASVTFSEAV